MLHRSLNFLLIIVLLIALVLKSPIGVNFLYDKGKSYYDKGNYEQAIETFEKALILKPDKPLLRYYYVSALTKMKLTYDVQKKLMSVAESKIEDEAKKYAQSRVSLLRQQFLKDFNPNYINHAVSVNSVIRWDISSFPLKVYIKNAQDAPGYFIENIKKSLSVWEQRSQFLKFEIVQDEKDANILFDFEEVPETNCSGDKCTYLTANTVPEISNTGMLKRMKITMYKKKPRSNEYYKDMEIYNTSLHELGHALGIMGHSENSEDLMYATNENIKNDYAYMRSEWQYLTMQDLRTLILLYRIHPTVSNVNREPSQNQFYGPFVLGTTDEILLKKLDECLKYVEKYPEIANGYINLAAVYADSGDFENGLKTLEKAERMNLGTNERYIIEYNRAIIYFNKKELQTALQHARRAQSIRDDKAINDLINEINTQINNK